MKKVLMFCIPLFVLGLLFIPQVFAESTMEKQSMEDTDSEIVLAAGEQEQAVSANHYVTEQTPMGEKVLMSGVVILMVLSVVFVVILEKRETFVR